MGNRVPCSRGGGGGLGITCRGEVKVPVGRGVQYRGGKDSNAFREE